MLNALEVKRIIWRLIRVLTTSGQMSSEIGEVNRQVQAPSAGSCDTAEQKQKNAAHPIHFAHGRLSIPFG